MEYNRGFLRGDEREVLVYAHSLDEAKHSVRPFVSSIICSFPLINAFGALMKVNSEYDLSQLPQVRALGENARVFATGVTDIGRDETEKLKSGDESRSQRGVGIAVIDTGVAPHLDLCMPTMRIAKFVDLVGNESEPYDDNGHGTAVCGLCAGNGLVSGGKLSVGAKNARLIAIKALDSRGEGSVFRILEAMQWIYDHRHRYGISVACMSLGCAPTSPDALSQGARALWRAGVTVVASAGNGGPKENSVTSPGICKEIITVGAIGKDENGVFIPDFSGRGRIGTVKPELVANGVEVRTLGTKQHYITLSGTSVAAPKVAALAARLLEQHPDYTPDKVKQTLVERAQRLDLPENAVGYGLIAD